MKMLHFNTISIIIIPEFGGNWDVLSHKLK